MGVCRHQADSWNGVSYQFGEQTAILIGKGGQCIHPDPSVKDGKDQAGTCDTSSEPYHKEKGKKRRDIEAGDRRRISLELSKNSHLLENQSPYHYNITNCGFSPAEDVIISERMTSDSQTLNWIPCDHLKAYEDNGAHEERCKCGR